MPDSKQNPGMEQARILRAGSTQEFFTSEQCYITEYSNIPEDPAVSIARARVEPGVTTRWHRLHGITERYFILSGQGEVELGELPPRPMGPGDVAIIPPGCRQRIRNRGDDDLVFLAICSPRFTAAAYEEL